MEIAISGAYFDLPATSARNERKVFIFALVAALKISRRGTATVATRLHCVCNFMVSSPLRDRCDYLCWNCACSMV